MNNSPTRGLANYSRTHYRVPADLPVICMTTKAAGAGRVTNISSAGCLVRGRLDVQAGNQICLRLRFKDEQECLDVESAVVRWTDGTSHGLEFRSLSPLSKRRLYSSLVHQVRISFHETAGRV